MHGRENKLIKKQFFHMHNPIVGSLCCEVGLPSLPRGGWFLQPIACRSSIGAQDLEIEFLWVEVLRSLQYCHQSKNSIIYFACDPI